MRKNLLLASLALTLVAGNVHASETGNDRQSQSMLNDSSIQEMKRKHSLMTQGALSEVGMEARRKLILSKKDDTYHEMIESGDINLSKSDQFSANQIIH